jgi:hypothetical protein
MNNASRNDRIHGDEHLKSQSPHGLLSNDYTINVNWDDMAREFMAVFDFYDGAPDGWNCIGRGDTKQEAVMNLIENASDDYFEI